MNNKRMKLIASLVFITGASVLAEGVTAYFNEDFTSNLFSANSHVINLGAALVMLAGGIMIVGAIFLFQRTKPAEVRITLR